MARLPDGVKLGPDGRPRCGWCVGSPDYVAYHDREWGIPVHDDHRLFEKLCLEGFQAGLSWLTILRKRDAFRAAFAEFDIDAVANFGPADVARLLGDAGIVRHRGKIEAAIGNARAARDLREECGSLAAFCAPGWVVVAGAVWAGSCALWGAFSGLPLAFSACSSSTPCSCSPRRTRGPTSGS